MVTRRGDRELLDVDDVGQLPNGTATLLIVEGPDGVDRHRAAIDKHGLIRSMSPDRAYFPAGEGWTAEVWRP